jgi:MFS family permease
MAFYINPTQLPYYLKALGIPAPAVAGLTLGTSALVMGLVALRYSSVLGLLGLRWSFCLGFGLMSVGFALTAAANGYWLVFVGMIFFGMGLGVTMPGLGTGAMMLAPPAVRGQVAGALTACVFLGQFLSPVMSTPVAESAGIATAFAVSSGLVAGLAVVAGMLALLGQRIAPPRGPEAR